MLLPIFLLTQLIVFQLTMPKPQLHEILMPEEQENNLFKHFSFTNSPKAVAPNTTEVKAFLEEVDDYWSKVSPSNFSKINWILYESEKDIIRQYRDSAKSIPIAVIFQNPHPSLGPLRYDIRTNATPINGLYGPSRDCRRGLRPKFVVEHDKICPVNSYYTSGFLTLQALIDYTRVKIDSKTIIKPDIKLQMLPKASEESDSLLLFRLLVPLYLVVALSQYLTFLMVLIVGEKEKKIKEIMKIMGLEDAVYWLSWFILYGTYVLLLSLFSIWLLAYLQVFHNSSLIFIFILILFYGLSIITFGFMLTTFFDRAQVAGILSFFILCGMSAIYYIQIFFENKGSIYLWLMSLLSPAGFALAVDKALLMDMLNNGVNFENLWAGRGVPFGGSIVMMGIDMVLYALLAYYLDNIIPSKYGIKKSMFFCCYACFWCPKGERTRNIATELYEGDFLDIESVPRVMLRKKYIKIVNLHKHYKQLGKPTVNAINGINLTVYEGQITAVIGHNGAGKTTLFNILSGLAAPTSGTAYVFGYDIRKPNQLDKVGKMMGVCPQDDILFENLTPREHLTFYASIKGIRRRELAVSKTLRNIGLADKEYKPCTELSGGQKRTLSVGIAIIGDPKIIILDEPTVGIDPYSRRHLWSVLQNMRQNRIILLTTHFMDEADILADRKAVLVRGRIRCCGSSLFLKHKFGSGYNLTVLLEDKLDEDFDINSITAVIQKHVAGASNTGRRLKELTYLLPYGAVDDFAHLFLDLEKNKNISSYGVSMTNLEEVFLHFQREQETEESVEDLTINRKMRKKNINIQTLGRIYEGNYRMSGKDLLDTVKCEPSTTQSFKAIIKLRLLRLKREIGKFLWMIILPICLAAVGLYTIDSLSMSSIKAPFLLNTGLYPDVPISIYNETYIKLGKLKKEDFDFMNHENFSTLLRVLPEAAAYNIAHINKEVSYTLLYSGEYVHSSPVLVNLINNAVYKNLKNNSNLIEVRSFPFGQKIIIKDSGATVVCLGIAILFPPVILATDFVYEREIKVKNQLRINGLSFYVYFTSFFLLHIIIVVLIYSVLLILTWSLTTTLSSAPSLVTLGVLLAMYCPASILFFIWLSYFFDKTQTAESTMLNLSMAFGFVPILIVMLAEKRTSRLCHMIFSFTNIMYLPFGIIYTLQKIAIECRNDENCLENRLEHYVTEEVRYMYISLMVHSPVFYIMVLIAEFFKSKDRCSDIFGKDSSLEDPKEIYDIGSNEDADVKTERNRVTNLLRNQGRTYSYPLVLVQNLHKEFKTFHVSKSGRKSKKVALKSLSVALDPGEVLGILGHNGAGKTTLMRTIIAEEKATRGRVQITGLKMGTYQTSLLKLIGYCPQNDAQWKTITIKEHLEMYAAIRGVPQKDIPRIIDLHLRGLQIEEYKDKRSGKCSGGTRRKLSYAIALVGSPKILLLDEPSTGMDPKSKRFLWDTVLANSQVDLENVDRCLKDLNVCLLYFKRSKGTILTTHSKEEAEALCSKVGILVKGELRCLGTPQHLKNLYGAGYTLEIKLSIGNGPGALERFKCRQFVFSEFPNALLEESFADRLLFSVPKRSILSLANCFKTLEEAKVKLNIEEYSFSQTTLDQVFLKFAYESEYED